MCCCGGRPSNTPTGGIPLPKEIHEKFPEDVKKAFEIFHEWLMGQRKPKRNEMPPTILEAYEKIKKAKIPGYGDITCESSCYMME